MYDSLSKIADRAYIIGFVLPTLLGSLLLVNFFGPSVPLLSSIASSVQSSTKLIDLTLFAVSVWAISVLLSALNYSFYRILEGYAPPLTWFPFVREVSLGKYRRLAARRDELYRARAVSAAFEKEKEAELRSIVRNIARRFPDREDLILPTSFGNTIRAFEYYPVAIYGVDSIAAWPRLASVITKEFSEALNNSRALVDFMVNSFFIAAAFFIYSIAALPAVVAGTGKTPWQPLALLAAAMLIVLVVTYMAAVDAAVAWGDSVKSAFDCYLPALIDQLRFDVSPELSQRREFWTAFSQQALYNVRLDSPKWKYKKAK